MKKVNFDEDVQYDHRAGLLSFRGHTGDATIQFGCTREALMGAAKLTEAADVDVILSFKKNRPRIEEIAEAKYLAGMVESNGSCIIRSSDLNR